MPGFHFHDDNRNWVFSLSFPFLCLVFLTVCLIISLLTDMSMVQINLIFNLDESGARNISYVALV